MQSDDATLLRKTGSRERSRSPGFHQAGRARPAGPFAHSIPVAAANTSLLFQVIKPFHQDSRMTAQKTLSRVAG